MITKTENDIRTELIQELAERLPNLDLTEGSPERDLFIESPLAGQLAESWNKIIYTAKLHAPHTYIDDLEEVDLQNYMDNYSVTPEGETYSEGTVTFYSNTEPTENIIITDGTVARTTDAVPVEFAVQGTYTMYQSIAASYYNATTERWEINCAVKALVPGEASVAGSNTVVELVSGISGISGVTNSDPITGGEPAESTEEALDRVLDTFQGRGLGPTQGLVNFILPYVDAVNSVGANDPLMVRDEGLGGKIDFYVIGEDLADATDTVAITSTGLSNGVNVSYTSTGIILENQPVREITALIVDDVVIQTSYYQLTQDTGILAKSTNGYDMVEVTSTGLQNGFSFQGGNTVEINYIYNALLTEIEDDLNSAENHYENRDYLLREMTEVTIDVYLEIAELSGQDFTTVSNTVELAISEYINSLKNTGPLELADIVGLAKSITSVDNINLTTADLTPTGGGTKTAQGDILFDKNEYPTAGSITIIQWTN